MLAATIAKRLNGFGYSSGHTLSHLTDVLFDMAWEAFPAHVRWDDGFRVHPAARAGWDDFVDAVVQRLLGGLLPRTPEGFTTVASDGARETRGGRAS